MVSGSLTLLTGVVAMASNGDDPTIRLFGGVIALGGLAMGLVAWKFWR
jgi:hypothetical protein